MVINVSVESIVFVEVSDHREIENVNLLDLEKILSHHAMNCRDSST